ncbi:hypothetical protein CVT26_001597 [Gymnopilus dilepis]|uniref:Hydrophobin n=1 Tax=Gymnopilus dilepis TaxID=231916 RepID=A0A409YXG8_9AGAR|nr:hypothetical protein CVT26_001597 [Gymnopilus dilepis]
MKFVVAALALTFFCGAQATAVPRTLISGPISVPCPSGTYCCIPGPIVVGHPRTTGSCVPLTHACAL